MQRRLHQVERIEQSATIPGVPGMPGGIGACPGSAHDRRIDSQRIAGRRIRNQNVLSADRRCNHLGGRSLSQQVVVDTVDKRFPAGLDDIAGDPDGIP